MKPRSLSSGSVCYGDLLSRGGGDDAVFAVLVSVCYGAPLSRGGGDDAAFASSGCSVAATPAGR